LDNKESMSRALVWIGCLVLTQFAAGQTTGRIVGTVKDPSGALVAGASVQCTLVATGETRKAFTDFTGSYTAPLLAPGSYQITISAKGFATNIFENVIVNLTETTVADAELSIATESTAVTISAASLIQTAGPQLGRVVDSRAVSELPLATRNFTQILGLSPGTATYLPDNTGLGRNTQTISVNGARVTQNSLQLNGVDVTTMGTAGVILVSVPAPESVQEFKVQTSLYDASFGRAGGGNLQIVTRSGSNEIHGAVYEYFRNEALNANNPFLKAAGLPQPVLKRQVFGGVAGGPIRKNRSFYFVSYQGTREINGASPLNSVSRSVLVDSRLTGDRSAQTLAKAFELSAIDPIALALLNTRLPNGQFVIPTPQANGRYSGSAISRYAEDQFNTNIDHRITEKNWLSARFFSANQPSTSALPTFKGSGANVPGFGTDQQQNNRVVVLQDQHAFSPTMLNEFRAGYTFNRNFASPQEPINDSDLGIRRANAGSFPGLGLIRIAPSSGGIVFGTQSNISPAVAFVITQADTLSIARGRHAVHAGEEIRWNGVNLRIYNQTRGQIDFASFRDFLTGNALTSTFGSGLINRNQRANDYNFFVQDDWKVSHKLTLNLGLRYELDLPAFETRGLLVTFDPSLYRPSLNGQPMGGFVQAENALPQYRLPSVPLAEKGLVQPDTTALAPRVGFAWSPLDAGRLILRGGAGVFHSRASFAYSSANATAPPLYVTGTRSAPPLADPFFAAPAPNDFPIFLPGINLSGAFFDRSIRTPVFYQYNLSVQHPIAQDLLLEMAYVGTRGLHLVRQVAINQARLASTANPVVNPATGEVVTTNTLVQANIFSRVPFPGANINSFFQNQSTAQSTYHSLQASLTKRFSRGMEFLVSYTFAKSIDNGSGAGGGGGTNGTINPNAPADGGGILGNQLDNRANRGVSDFDRTHRLVASWLWDLPKASVARPLLDAWKISGIVTAMSGLPIDIVDTGAGSFYGLANGGNPLARPNAVAQAGPAPSGYFFNPFAFSRPVVQAGEPILSSGGFAIAGATGTDIGNVGRNILRGLRQANVDFAIARRFPFRETKAIEIRAEFLNIFNWVNYANPLSDFNGFASSGGSIDSLGHVVNPGDFGRIISTSNNPRITQFALKIHF
jgi:Carboxypeptidase regulatory-like domain